LTASGFDPEVFLSCPVLEEVDMPSVVETVRLASWEEFKGSVFQSLFREPRFAPGRFLFRGHGRGDWKLMTSFDRWYQIWGKPGGANKFELAIDLVRAFVGACEIHGLRSNLKPEDPESIALAQHYGVPTRLLDWTESPYIAAFFAYYDHLRLETDSHDTVAVWALDKSAPMWTEDYGVTVIKAYSFNNERLRNQSGVFTLSRTPFDTLEEYVEKQLSLEPVLFRFLLPASDVTAALADLSAMGITPGRMFADLEGAAASAVQQIILALKK
jgi:hypothetical protein